MQKLVKNVYWKCLQFGIIRMDSSSFVPSEQLSLWIQFFRPFLRFPPNPCLADRCSSFFSGKVINENTPSWSSWTKVSKLFPSRFIFNPVLLVLLVWFEFLHWMPNWCFCFSWHTSSTHFLMKLRCDLSVL